MPRPYNEAVMTAAGAILLDRVRAGLATIEFTRMAAGDGTYTAEEKISSALRECTGLKSSRNSYTLSSVSTIPDGGVKLTALFTDQDPVTGEALITEGYHINEIGLYAKEKDADDSTEVLYSITVAAGDIGDYMPAYTGGAPVQIVQEYRARVSDAETVSITSAGAVMLAEDARERFREMYEEIEAKVAKVEGMGLSSNDFTDEEKEKLAGFSGDAGKSAYQIAVDDGFVGTETEWLESLRGEPGTPGTDGSPGAPGTDGTDGLTPTIGANGNWYLGSTDTGKPSRGEKGEPGTDATTTATATTSANGLMSDTDKTKLDRFGDGYIVAGKKSGTALGYNTTAEGYDTTASSWYCHAEGSNTTASDVCAHAEGSGTTASNASAHAEGQLTTASGSYSHAEGNCTTASNIASHAGGKYNKAMTAGGSNNTNVGDAFVIGNGTGSSRLSNAFRVTYTGAAYGLGAFNTSGADYAEFIEPWHDDNPDREDRVGYFVTVKGGLLYKADAGDYIAGITSGSPSVVGNADEDYYHRWERDEFGRILWEDVPEMIEELDEEGRPVVDEEGMPVMVPTGRMIKNGRMKERADYDPSLQEVYIERKDRPEWDYVGMLGVLPVRDDGTCVPGSFCRCADGGIATLATERGFDTYMVIERITDSVVKVILR